MPNPCLHVTFFLNNAVEPTIKLFFSPGFRNTMKKMVGIEPSPTENLYNEAAKLPNPSPIAG